MFISATSQITVSTPPVLGNWSAPTNGSVTSRTTAPARTAMIAAPICPSSFTAAGRSIQSSIAPTSVITPAPAITPQVSTVPPGPGRPCATCWRMIWSGSQIAAATTTPARIANPPSSGVSLTASPRSFGFAVALIFQASRAATGVSSNATAVATRKAYTASE